ncbi:MAG: GGDEF domain-containing protein [Nitrospiraceae bacterium]|nr:MAG: GGDEF domain-containing protein [Nitrospiraceae bacterium]
MKNLLTRINISSPFQIKEEKIFQRIGVTFLGVSLVVILIIMSLFFLYAKEKIKKNLIADGTVLTSVVARYSLSDLKKKDANRLFEIINYSGMRSGLIYSFVMDNNKNTIVKNVKKYVHNEHIATRSLSSINPLMQTYKDNKTDYTIYEFSHPLFINGIKEGTVRLGFSPDINPLFSDSDMRGMLLIGTLFFTLVPTFYYMVRGFIRLHILSITDELTGLYNRRGFFKLAENRLMPAKRTEKKLMLLYADLDNMKEINDEYGHNEGDRMLIKTANILKITYRESDIIARIGGDEFVVFPVGSSEDHVDIIVNRLKENIDKYNKKNNNTYSLNISTGVATYDPHSVKSLEELISQADRIMYENKKRRKNTFNSSNSDIKGYACSG